MSKRPKMAERGAVSSHPRQPAGRLRDMPIWSKLGLIMIVPIIATVVVGANSVVDHTATARNAERARVLAMSASASGELVHGLQDERASAVLLLGTDAKQMEQLRKYRDAYGTVRSAVDKAKDTYAQRRAELEGLPTNVTELLSEIDKGLTDLPGTRSQVDNLKIRLSDAIRVYDSLIGNLLDMRDSSVQLANDFGLSQRMRAVAAVARSKEFVSQKRIVVHRALIQNSLTSALRTEFIAAEQGQAQALQSFDSVATSAEAELHTQTVAGTDLRAAEQYSEWVKTKPVESMQYAPFKADQWDAALVSNAKLIRTVEAKLDSGVVNRATELRDQARRQLFVESGLLLGTLLLAILFAWLVARSMARSLRELRHGALSVAQYGLPQAVARLRDPQVSAQLSPEQAAHQIAEPLPVRGKDEFAQVTEAFNAVHLEAVRTAAEQAALRSSVNTMFVNLARRSQILVDRLISHLDRLERGEEDPDRLGELFQLDHLATRMRRNDENLLVLAGADSSRVQREPAALLDVLRAAQSEVEHYTRIEFGVIDRDIEIIAQAVNDTVHLVAELFDNATEFSPPDTQVLVEARRVGEQAMLYVEDRGIGLSADQLQELNERLATPPTVDVTVSRMMGLVVVSRLASRHGVKVELRPAAERGVVAEVMLPTSVLVPRALSGRIQHVGEAVAAAAQPPVTQRPFGQPLALEAGRAGSGPAGAGALGARPIDGPRGSQFTAPAAMPAWSDPIGATSAGGVSSTAQFSAAERADVLPKRRAGESWPAEGEMGAGPHIPRQTPQSPEAHPYAAQPPAPVTPVASVQAYRTPVPPAALPPAAAPAQPSPRPVSSPGTAVPPVWPPAPSVDRRTPAPPVPERLAASLDLTAELPRVPGPGAGVSGQTAASSPRFVDETMELPIFRELESAWFRTRRSVPEDLTEAPANRAPDSLGRLGLAEPEQDSGAAPRGDSSWSTSADQENADSAATAGGVAAVDAAPSADGARVTGLITSAGGRPTGTRGGPTGGSNETEGWRTAADDGWRAASAAAAAPVKTTTSAGLPKRVPMAQLVPGGVDKPANPVQRRTPESVRGLLSTYHRGVQRGRGSSKDEDSGATLAGQQSSQSGIGNAAGSGQKEHQE